MELFADILKFSIGGITIAGICVFFGKLVLSKSSELLIENHKSRLEISRIEHQIKFTNLHNERGQIIKKIYQDYYDLELKLEHMTTLFQGPKWKTDNTRDEATIEKFHETKDTIERNRIYFSEILCDKLESALDNYMTIINQMLKAKQHAKYETDENGYRFPEGQGSFELWKEAENKTKTEIRHLRLELANEFRGLIGV